MDRSQAEKDLEFIKQMIEDSRTYFNSNGLYLIIWGLMSVFGTILTYVMISLKMFNLIFAIWAGFFVTSGLIIFYNERKYKKAKIKSIVEKIYNRVWIGIIIFLAVIFCCIIISGKYSINIIFPVLSGVLGIGYFICSNISRNLWLLILSFVWWAGCFILIFTDLFFSPLVICGLVIICELIPGTILFIKSKKNKSHTVK
jgi:hypothetical protein